MLIDVCACVYSQKLQLLTTGEIQTLISHGAFVTEKLGLKMEIPNAQWTEETNSRRQESGSELEYKQLVSTIMFSVIIIFSVTVIFSVILLIFFQLLTNFSF